MVTIYGDLIDKETRCIDYHGPTDIVALKCFACQKYYPCFLCHNRHETHNFQAYLEKLKKDKVVFCGSCQRELTIEAYKEKGTCPFCHHLFNPNCKVHYNHYFRN
ncbi:CHY zinc finger protein [Streptococcus mutans]|uniref:CHY zinc finger protein n=1 Tax=Streptococcus mutans TaxID=1309 RepID=UPI0014551015|nr:CHY zinc finger protein [Streptococcus mutans]MCB5153661.1 hypothetical protein [Streptococcus mutans]NLQ80685.1 hypothetical protein [Streptococcus mutans]